MDMKPSLIKVRKTKALKIAIQDKNTDDLSREELIKRAMV